jgi:hypothetical protein
MAQHCAQVTSRGRIVQFTQWAGAAIAAVLIFAIGCVGGYQAKDSFGEPPFWIIFGGNTDPGDGTGQGMARDQMVAGGWVSYENSYQVQWQAAIQGGTARETDDAMANGHNAFNHFCAHRTCVIAGFSLGTSPALQLASETGTPPDRNYIFGAPQPSTGIWHSSAVGNPIVEPFVAEFGDFKTNRPVPAGTQVYYNVADPYANMAPQCTFAPSLFSLNLNGHYIVGRNEAVRVWTGSDGAIMHEAGLGQNPLLVSGADPSPPWQGCPLGGYSIP